MFSFFKLYINPDHILSSSSGIMLLLLYGNIILYMIDFYHLMKRKSKAETVAVLLIPVTASCMGAMLATLYVYVPEPSALGDFASAFSDKELSRKLLLVPAAYLLLWGISFFWQRKRSKEDFRRWIYSGIPDNCFTAMILFCLAGNLLTGSNMFSPGREWILWLFLYALYFLSCKIFLLGIALLVQLFSMRISFFNWNAKKSPGLFLPCYYLFCQNCILRNTLLFELGLLIPLMLTLYIYEGYDSRTLFIIGFLCLCALFVILFSVGHVATLMNKFDMWSRTYDCRELFCREYFQEQPIYKDSNYTITRHFLVDEQRPSAIYYWKALQRVGNLSINSKGKSRTLYFSDGANFIFINEEIDMAKPVFAYAGKMENPQAYPYYKLPPRKTVYSSLVKIIMFILIFTMLFVSMNLNTISH